MRLQQQLRYNVAHATNEIYSVYIYEKYLAAWIQSIQDISVVNIRARI